MGYVSMRRILCVSSVIDLYARDTGSSVFLKELFFERKKTTDMHHGTHATARRTYSTRAELRIARDIEELQFSRFSAGRTVTRYSLHLNTLTCLVSFTLLQWVLLRMFRGCCPSRCKCTHTLSSWLRLWELKSKWTCRAIDAEYTQRE